MTIVGQDKIINKINSLTLDTFPHSLMLVGPKGSGKFTLCKYISEHLGLESHSITNNLTLEKIDSINASVTPAIYTIDGTEIDTRAENVILKFVEEPLKNAFIIITCENKSQLLPTVVNRCQVWNLESYSKEILKQFTDNDVILSIAKTPGVAKELSNLFFLYGYKIEDMLALADKIYDKIANANIANILTISDKIAFKDEQDKFDFDLFLEVLKYSVFNKYVSTCDTKFFQAYNLTNKLYNNRYISHINKKQLFEHFLFDIKYVMKGEQ